MGGGLLFLRDSIPYAVSDSGDITVQLNQVLQLARQKYGPLIVTGKAGAIGSGRDRVLYLCSAEAFKASAQGTTIRQQFSKFPEGLTTHEFSDLLPNVSYHTVREYVSRALMAGLLEMVRNEDTKHKPGVPGRVFRLKE